MTVCRRSSPVLHLSSLQQLKGFSDDRVEDLVADGQLVLKALRQGDGSGLLLCPLAEAPRLRLSAQRYLVRAQLLPEADVGAGHVRRQTVLHPLQEGHPALALLLEALPPQPLRLRLAVQREETAED